MIEVGIESETPNKLGNARSRLLARQVEKAGVKLEILAGRQLRVERKRLRHIADALAGIEIGRVDPLAEEEGFACRCRQKPGEHLHRRRLSAAVRPQKPENLAALDGEADAIDGGKISEPAGQVPRRDDRLVVVRPARRYCELPSSRPALLRKQGEEGLLDRRRLRLRPELRRRAGSQHASAVHGDELIEALGLLHVGGGNDHTHAGPTDAHPLDQIPELTA